MEFLLRQFTTLEGLKETDIVCAQSRSVGKLPGNRRYGKLVQDFHSVYTAASTNDEKARITRQVIDMVQQGQGAPRFMRFNKSSQTWGEMEKTAIHEKVGHALRAKQRQRRAVKPSEAENTNSKRACAPTPPSAVSVTPKPQRQAPTQQTQHQQRPSMILPPDLMRLLTHSSVDMSSLLTEQQPKQQQQKPLEIALRSSTADLLMEALTETTTDNKKGESSFRRLSRQISGLEPLHVLRCLSDFSVGSFAGANNSTPVVQRDEAVPKSSSEPVNVFEAFGEQQMDEFLKSWRSSSSSLPHGGSEFAV